MSECILPQNDKEYRRDMNKAYQQGRADERREWESAASELIIKYAEDVYEALPDIIKDIQNKTRADAIYELLKAISDKSYKIEEDYTVGEFARVCIWEDDLQKIAEQLKEK